MVSDGGHDSWSSAVSWERLPLLLLAAAHLCCFLEHTDFLLGLLQLLLVVFLLGDQLVDLCGGFSQLFGLRLAVAVGVREKGDTCHIEGHATSRRYYCCKSS